jgi:hypothetical protein
MNNDKPCETCASFGEGFCKVPVVIGDITWLQHKPNRSPAMWVGEPEFLCGSSGRWWSPREEASRLP